MRWSRREGEQEGSGRSRKAFPEGLPGPNAGGPDVFGCVCSCAAAGTNPCGKGPAVPDAKHLGCRCRRITAADPVETKLRPLLRPMIPSANHPVVLLERGGKRLNRRCYFKPNDWCKNDGTACHPNRRLRPARLRGCDKEKEWSGDSVEILATLPSFVSFYLLYCTVSEAEDLAAVAPSTVLYLYLHLLSLDARRSTPEPDPSSSVRCAPCLNP